MIYIQFSRFLEKRRFTPKGFDPYIIISMYDEDELNLSIPHLSLGANDDHEKQAELLFEFLRDIDKKGYKKVIVHAPLKKGVGLAVYNRLIRAAGFKVIEL